MDESGRWKRKGRGNEGWEWVPTALLGVTISVESYSRVETGCRGVDEEGGGRSVYGVEASKEGIREESGLCIE